MPEFDRAAVERFMRVWVHCAYAIGTVVWLALALATHSVGWWLVVWFALWGLTWVINVRGVAAASRPLADLHTYGALIPGKVLRTWWLLSAGMPLAEVRLDPGDGGKPIKLSCFGLPSQIRSLHRGDEVRVLYAPGTGGVFGRSPRACLPLWRPETPSQTADESPGDAMDAEASGDDAIKRKLALCLAPLATYYTRRSVGCATLALLLPAVSLVVCLAWPPAGLVLLVVGCTAALLEAWLSSKRAVAAAVRRFDSRFDEQDEERARALALLSEIGKTSPNYKTLADALAGRGTVSNEA
jgi:hypothetical protein